MRVLVVHNRYSSRVPSGENLAVDDEVRWLRDAGVDVRTHMVSNDDVDGSTHRQMAVAAQTPWSLTAQRAMSRAIDDLRPDVVHVHNLFPLLSASVPWAASRREIPVVWTVHNHRVTCVIGTNYRDGAPCQACRPGWRLPGIRHGCYAQSHLASALATGGTAAFRRLARRRLTPVAISHHVERWLVESAGFSPDRIRVKYNGVAAAPPETSATPATRRSFLLAGYLTDYKGVSLLLDAWNRLDDLEAELRIVGDGPLADRVRAAATNDSRICWFPQAPVSEMATHLDEARTVLVPSLWDEPFGRTAAEAFAHGRPVITTGSGALREIVDDETGWVTGTDPAALARAIAAAATDDDAVDRKGDAAHQRYQDRFSPRTTTRRLIAIYESVAGTAATGRETTPP